MTARHPGPVEWKESWDHHVHAFREFGDFTSTGLCKHIATTGHLTEPPEYSRHCGACLLIREAELAAWRDRGTVQTAVWDIIANGPAPAVEPPSPHPGPNCGCRTCRTQYGFNDG